MTLERRTPLRRTGGPKRSAAIGRGQPLQRGAPLARTGRLRPVSEKRAGELDAHQKVRLQVFDRDGYTCRLAGIPLAGTCTSRLTVHHIRKASAGGGYTARNLISLCAHHNDWIETDAGQGPAHAWGLWARHGESLDLCWQRMAAAGIVSYDWNGDPTCP